MKNKKIKTIFLIICVLIVSVIFYQKSRPKKLIKITCTGKRRMGKVIRIKNFHPEDSTDRIVIKFSKNVK